MPNGMILLGEDGMISKRIAMARKGKGWIQTQLAEALGVSVDTVRRWEQGKRTPDTDMLQRLARALDTSTSYLLGETDDPKRYTSRLSELVGTDGNESSLLITSKHGISGSSEAESPLPESNVRLLSERIVEIPVYPISACMGKGFDNEGEACAAIDTLYLSRDSVGVDAPERPFALLVEGNSMSPAIEDGERIVVNPHITLGRGDVCLARIRSNGYLRDAVKFYFPRPGGGCILKSSETSGIPPLEFTPQEVKDNDVVIVGRVVYIDTGRKI